MADSKISELTALTGANSADTDVIAVVDTDAVETKKMALSELDSRVLGKVASQSSATVATGDLLLINDVDDSNNPKQVTAQSVADLAAATSHYGNPASTEWLVGWTDWTHNEVFANGVQVFEMSPFACDFVAIGTGVSNFHQDSTTDQSIFGVHQWRMGSASGNYGTISTDLESMNLGVHTWRVGCRIMIEDIPASGGEDFYIFTGFNSLQSYLNTSNYAVLGIAVADNATNFVVKTHGGSSETVTDTGVAFAADTWYNLEVELTPTTVSAWVNGTLVLDASTSNVPTTATTMAAQPFVHRRVGSPAATRDFYTDWSYIAIKPGAARGAIGSGGPWG